RPTESVAPYDCSHNIENDFDHSQQTGGTRYGDKHLQWLEQHRHADHQYSEVQEVARRYLGFAYPLIIIDLVVDDFIIIGQERQSDRRSERELIGKHREVLQRALSPKYT